MSGRIEKENKLIQTINTILTNKPQYLWEWKNSLIASQKTASTTKDYICKVLKFLEDNNYDLSINTTLDYFVNIQTKSDKNGNIVRTSDSYRQSVWYCLNNFFTFMVKMGYVEQNPMVMIDKPKNHDLARINENRILLTKDDFEDILESVRTGVGSHKAKARQAKWKERDLAIMALLMSTGMRKSALLSMDVDDINKTDMTIRIIDKGDKLHIYNLTSKTINILEEWLEKREKILENNINEKALFISGSNKRLKNIDDLIEKYCKDALNMHISPHKIRAGFTSIMYQETGDIEFCRRVVGHANVGTTQRYIVTDNKEREKSAEIMNSLF